MKKGVFGTWFKELASLIFTQTVQAFLLAIIMSIIVNALSSSTSNGATYGAGLLAIIALSQFGKIELLIKNIFGVTSQFGGSMQDGMGGLLAGAMALKLGKNVLDNGKKIVDGRRQSKLANRELTNLQNEKKNLELGGVADDAELNAQNALNAMGDTADKFIDDAQTGAGMAAGARAFNGSSLGGGVGVSSSQIDQLISALKEQTSTIKSQKADMDKKDNSDKLNDLNKKILEAQNKKDAGKRLARSGVTETIGAAYVGTMGAMVGLAQGDNVIRNAATGAGIADRVIANRYERSQKKADYKTDQAKLDIDTSDIDKKLNATQNRITSANTDRIVYNKMKKSLESANSSGFMKNRTSQDRAKAVEQLQKNIKKKIDASNMQ